MLKTKKIHPKVFSLSYKKTDEDFALKSIKDSNRFRTQIHFSLHIKICFIYGATITTKY